jgi:(S)-mandelate dehydrogenase
VPPRSIEQWRQLAKRRLPGFVYDYVEGGADNEEALALNRAAFRSWRIVPRVLRGAPAPTTESQWFGTPSQLPIVIAPTGLNGLVRPGGDQLLARAAARAGVPFAMSTAANATLEQVIAASGVAPWFQLYVMDRDVAFRQVDLASTLGCPVLVLTVDVPAGGRRTRDLRNGLRAASPPSPKMVLDAVRRPIWTIRQLAGPHARRLPMLGQGDGAANSALQSDLRARRFDATLDWEFLGRLRDRWRGPLVLKGVMAPKDALRAAEIGVDGVVISNHGGRQLDSAPSSLVMLPQVVAAVADRLVILLDGGVRNGADILKAMALGAKGVLIGRPTLYGLAGDGGRGAEQVLDNLRTEILAALLLSGLSHPRDATPGMLIREPQDSAAAR